MLLNLPIIEHQPRFPTASTLIMGKTDPKQTQKRARKATSCKSKHKTADGESKHKKQPSFDATKFEATNDDDLRHSKWRDQFKQLCDFKVQFGNCLVPKPYAANPKLGNWVVTQRSNCKLFPDGTPSRMPAERIRALNGILVSSGMLVGTHGLKNCVNTRRNSATASCHRSTLQTPSSVIG